MVLVLVLHVKLKFISLLQSSYKICLCILVMHEICPLKLKEKIYIKKKKKQRKNEINDNHVF